MSETPQQPELDDETPEPTEPKKEPIVSTSDVVVLLVLAILGVVFWLWYRGEGSQSRSRFVHADSLYAAHRFPQALAEYRALRDSEKVIEKDEDSLLYRRLDSLSTLEDHAGHLVEGAKAAILSKDTALVRVAYEALASDSSGFVPDSIVARLKTALPVR